MARIHVGEWLSDDSLTLEGIPSATHPAADGGGSYTIPSLSAADGVLLTRITAGSSADLTTSWTDDAREAIEAFCKDVDGNETTMAEKLFGDAHKQMLADGVSNNRMHDLVGVVVQQALSGTEIARMFVEQRTGEAQARPNRATRRATAKNNSSSTKAGSNSPRASGAKSTRSTPASTRGSETSGKPAPEVAAKTA